MARLYGIHQKMSRIMVNRQASCYPKQCLRSIPGAFKATPIPVLETETFIAPIDIHLEQLQAKAKYRLRAGGQAKFINTAYGKIANKLRGKAGRRRIPQPTPGSQKHNWAQKILANAQPTPFLDPLSPWSKIPWRLTL